MWPKKDKSETREERKARNAVVMARKDRVTRKTLATVVIAVVIAALFSGGAFANLVWAPNLSTNNVYHGSASNGYQEQAPLNFIPDLVNGGTLSAGQGGGSVTSYYIPTVDEAAVCTTSPATEPAADFTPTPGAWGAVYLNPTGGTCSTSDFALELGFATATSTTNSAPSTSATWATGQDTLVISGWYVPTGGSNISFSETFVDNIGAGAIGGQDIFLDFGAATVASVNILDVQLVPGSV